MNKKYMNIDQNAVNKYIARGEKDNAVQKEEAPAQPTQSDKNAMQIAEIKDTLAKLKDAKAKNAMQREENKGLTAEDTLDAIANAMQIVSKS